MRLRQVNKVSTGKLKSVLFFLKRGGQITAKVTGPHQNRGLVIGLEIPVLYTFTGLEKDTKNLSALLK